MLAGPPRRGATLLELLVTLVIAGIALSLVAAISARQQRVVADLQENAALSSQLGDAISILPIDLGAVSSIAGDIREARDTSIEIRATSEADPSTWNIVHPGGDDPRRVSEHFIESCIKQFVG